MKISFVYKGKYYEYKDIYGYMDHEDLYPSYIKSLYSQRAALIKDLQVKAQLYAEKVTQNQDEKTIEIFSEMAEYNLEKIYRCEEEIVEYKKSMGLDYSDDITEPINEDEATIVEEQRCYACSECGEVYDYTNMQLEFVNGFWVCGKCHGNSVYITNYYLFRGNQLQNKALELEEQKDLLKSLECFKIAIEEYKKVDIYYEDNYTKSLLEIAQTCNCISRVYRELGKTKDALDYSTEAVERWIDYYNNEGLYFWQYNRIVIAYIYKAIDSEKLNNYDQCYECYDNAIKLASKGVSFIDKLILENKIQPNDEEVVIAYDNLENNILHSYIQKAAIKYDTDNLFEAKEIAKQCAIELNILKHVDLETKNQYRNLINEILNSESAPKTKKSGCYIATAVYGDYNAPEVLVLRTFRDNVLSNSQLGRIFIKVYYTLSPGIADKLRGAKTINKIVKKVLDLLVNKLKKNREV